MSTLLLRLAAYMQSWGTSSKFDIRDTGREPSKSGVLGMLAAALGIRRDDISALEELSHLRFGVRVDKEGKIIQDFHMVHGIKKGKVFSESKTSTGKTRKYNSPIKLHNLYLTLDENQKFLESYVTQRYYLCDAVFLCGLESEDEAALKRYEQALKHPVFPLYLGRRTCSPTMPLVLGIRDCDLETALRTEPELANSVGVRRIVMDAKAEDSTVAIARDVPISFDPRRREFGYREYKEIYLPGKEQTEHDSFAEVEAKNVSDAHGT